MGFVMAEKIEVSLPMQSGSPESSAEPSPSEALKKSTEKIDETIIDVASENQEYRLYKARFTGLVALVSP